MEKYKTKVQKITSCISKLRDDGYNKASYQEIPKTFVQGIKPRPIVPTMMSSTVNTNNFYETQKQRQFIDELKSEVEKLKIKLMQSQKECARAKNIYNEETSKKNLD